ARKGHTNKRRGENSDNRCSWLLLAFPSQAQDTPLSDGLNSLGPKRNNTCPTFMTHRWINNPIMPRRSNKCGQPVALGIANGCIGVQTCGRRVNATQVNVLACKTCEHFCIFDHGIEIVHTHKFTRHMESDFFNAGFDVKSRVPRSAPWTIESV